MDELDALCKLHDECYDKVEERDCKNIYLEYIALYSWKLISSGNHKRVRKDDLNYLSRQFENREGHQVRTPVELWNESQILQVPEFLGVGP